MKKLLLPVLISCALLNACHDKEIVSLNEQIQQQTAQLAQAHNQVAQLNKQIQTLQAQLNQAQTKQAIEAQTEVYFSYKENVPYELKGKNGEPNEKGETPVEYEYAVAKTNIDWLNTLLEQYFFSSFKQDNNLAPTDLPQLKSLLTQSLQEDKKQINEYGGLGINSVLTQSFVWQRGNYALFEQFNYSYAGGAHGLYGTDYINVDMEKQAILILSDILTQPEELRELLWQTYVVTYANGDEKEVFTEKSNFYISENFKLSPNGITFVYPIYAIASFAEGEQELFLFWEQIEKWLIPTFKESTIFKEFRSFPVLFHSEFM